MTKNELTSMLIKKFEIPNGISENKITLCHLNHIFKFKDLISFIQSHSLLKCPICKSCGHIYYKKNDENTNDHILDLILDDNDDDLLNLLFNEDIISEFNSSYLLPKILRDGPSFLSLCAFFGSDKCFFTLFENYLHVNYTNEIEQKDRMLRLPIHFACFGGNLLLVKHLINLSNEYTIASDYNGLQPVHYAAKGGKCKMKLLKKFLLMKNLMKKYKKK